MADENQLKLIKEGVEVWNEWRVDHLEMSVDLTEANFKGIDLTGAYLRGANLTEAILTGANLRGADLIGAILTGADLRRANLTEANLTGANLREADLTIADLRRTNLSRAYLKGAILTEAILTGADLTGADLLGAYFTGADLTGAYLRRANLQGTNLTKADLSEVDLQYGILVKANLDQATLTGCKIFGLSAWDLKGVPKVQSGLVITPYEEPAITVDDLQVAQFIYLLLNNKNVRNVIDTITSKAVLILGRFTDERKVILDAIQDELRKRNYLPILFDFNGPENRDITETVSILAHMAKFVIADITDAKSIPQELQIIIPDLPSVPVQPILLSSQTEYGMFGHFKRYPWVLETFYYDNINELIGSLSERIIKPLELKVKELNKK